MIGYALFAWLAMMRARGESFIRAARFSPFMVIFAVFSCVTGADLIATNLSPHLLLHPGWFAETAYYVVRVFTAGLALYAIGAVFVSKRFAAGSHATVFAAGAGYLILTHAIQWIHLPARYSHGEPLWLLHAVRTVSDFTFTALWDISFIAFAVVLAAPDKRQDRSVSIR